MTKYRDKDDGTLVNLVLLGEEDAFTELVERYESKVKKTAESIIGNPFSAEDVAQDTFLAVWAHLRELRYRDKFEIWLLRVTANCAKKLLRHYKTNLHSISADLDMLPDPESDSVLSMEAWQENKNGEKLLDAVEALSDALRDTVLLYYLDGYGIKEISYLLSVPEGTVKRRLSEGRKQLRRGFGIPEEGRGRLAARVRRQIEELKRWAIKNDKSAFVETYGSVLSLVEQMEDSTEKSALRADVLLRGMWWLPGQDNERLRAEIKAAALEGHNEDVMMSIAFKELTRFQGEEKNRFIREKLIPELKAAGFSRTLGAVYFWLGHSLAGMSRAEESLAAFGKVTDCLPPSHVYYAAAVSALRAESRFFDTKDPVRAHVACMGESYEKQDGKWVYSDQPGYTRGQSGSGLDAVPFFWLSRCDGLIDDPTLQPGDTRKSEDGKVTLTLKKADASVEVPAGMYENCLIYETKGESFTPLDIETVICPGVGIIKQTNRLKGIHYLLVEADVKGGGGFPFVVGNRWKYHAEREGSEVFWRDEQTTEIMYASDRLVTASVSVYAEAEFGTSSWRGNMAAARNLYHIGNRLCDVEQYLRRAEELSSTPREKTHTAAAADVMRRIFRTDPEFNPDWTERGIGNAFKMLTVSRSGRETLLLSSDRKEAFEWKTGGTGCGYHATLYSALYEIVAAACGMIWSDEWIPGFQKSGSHMLFDKVVKTDLKVGEDEDVTTPAGVFPRCRHIVAETAGYADYWSGHLEIWYAPGVGPVKFLRLGTAEDEPEDAKGPFVWELTEYRGTSEEYFPLDDGLLRRYEPAEQPLPDGYRGWVEYTYSTDETGSVIFKNAGGVQDRAAAESL